MHCSLICSQPRPGSLKTPHQPGSDDHGGATDQVLTVQPVPFLPLTARAWLGPIRWLSWRDFPHPPCTLDHEIYCSRELCTAQAGVGPTGRFAARSLPLGAPSLLGVMEGFGQAMERSVLHRHSGAITLCIYSARRRPIPSDADALRRGGARPPSQP